MNQRLLVILSLSILAGLTVTSSIGWYVASQESNSKNVTTNEPVKLTLPTDATARNISDCFDRKGVHFSRPADAINAEKPWGGPTYAYWPATGQVTAIEYHIKESELKRARTDPASIANEEYNLKGANYDHFTLVFQPNGHSGYAVPHYDIHAYVIDKAQRDALKCPKNETATPSAVKGSSDYYAE